MPLSKGELKTLLARHGLRLSKRRGQNYLIDPVSINGIAHACGFPPEAAVVEIGAGLGALTEALARRAGRVEAVEIDRGILPLLRERMRACPNVAVVESDILDLLPRIEEPRWIAGAIPYSLTSPILLALCDRPQRFRGARLLMQEEVAARIAAPAGDAAYGRLSVMVAYFWKARQLLSVPPEAFYPKPKVESRLLGLDPADHGLRADEEGLRACVKAAFGFRRKKALYGLTQGPFKLVERAPAEAVFERAGISLDARAQEITLEQYVALANALTKAATGDG